LAGGVGRTLRIKTVKEKRPERVKDGYTRAVQESDGYRTV
jgi:hypothetical protein